MLTLRRKKNLRRFATHYDTKKIFVPFNHRFVLRKYLRKDKTSQIYLHVTSDGIRDRIPLDQYITPKHWSKAKQRGKGKQYKDFNLVLDNIESTITEIKTQYRLLNKVLTVEKFKKEFSSGFSRVDFISYLKTNIELDKNTLKPGTYRRYKVVYSKLKNWKKHLFFSDITHESIRKIRKQLRSLGNSQNTIESNMSVIRKYLRNADKDGIKFPLDLGDIKIRNVPGNRISLKPEEVKKMYEYYESQFITPARKLILGYFLFSCFTGLRIGDIYKLKREDISDSFQIVSSKNSKILTINLTKKAKAVLKQEPRLFEDFLTKEYVNRELKVIANTLGIKTNVTFHVARHSFATNYIRLGGNVILLSKLLGHSNIKTTMIYVSIVEEEHNKDIHLLDEMF